VVPHPSISLAFGRSRHAPNDRLGEVRPDD